MVLYKNTKAMVWSQGEDTDYFDVLTSVLQGDTVTPFLFILSLDYVLPTPADQLNETGFTLEKARSRSYPT